MIIYKEPIYGIINENTSKLYPGCKVQILKYIESTDQYQVKNIESDYITDVSKDGVDLI